MFRRLLAVSAFLAACQPNPDFIRMRSIALFMLGLSMVVACQPVTSATGDGGSADGSPSDASRGPVKLGCVDILTCAGKCTDKACDDACIQKGTPEAQQEVNALLGCGATNMCKDTMCLETNCDAEITACAEDVPSGEVGPPPIGDLPTALVGTWQSVSGTLPGTSYKHTFDANGLWVRVYKLNEADCSNAVIKSKMVIDDGKWAVQGNVLTTVPERTQQTTTVCAGGTSTSDKLGFDRTFKVTIMGNTLILAATDDENETITYVKQ